MIAQLQAEHRRIEELLDRMPGAFAAARAALAAHYAGERPFLDLIRPHWPALAAKLEDQHDEVEEIGAALERSLTHGHERDIQYLGLRFCALARHNIIEEERDVFPLAARLPELRSNL